MELARCYRVSKRLIAQSLASQYELQLQFLLGRTCFQLVITRSAWCLTTRSRFLSFLMLQRAALTNCCEANTHDVIDPVSFGVVARRWSERLPHLSNMWPLLRDVGSAAACFHENVIIWVLFMSGKPRRLRREVRQETLVDEQVVLVPQIRKFSHKSFFCNHHL